MFILYDTENELTISDYKPISCLIIGKTAQQLIDILENLESALDNASIYHSDLLELALSNDVILIKRKLFSMSIHTMSSGTIAGIIGNTKYSQIDIAVNKALQYTYNCDGGELLSLPYNYETACNLVLECYIGKRRMAV